MSQAHGQPIGTLLKDFEGGRVAPVTSHEGTMSVGQHHPPMICQDNPMGWSLIIGSVNQQAPLEFEVSLDVADSLQLFGLIQCCLRGVLCSGICYQLSDGLYSRIPFLHGNQIIVAGFPNQVHCLCAGSGVLSSLSPVGR